MQLELPLWTEFFYGYLGNIDVFKIHLKTKEKTVGILQECFTSKDLPILNGNRHKSQVENPSIPTLGRSPGEGKGYPLQYSGLENFMDYIVHGIARSRTQLSNFHFHIVIHL